MSFIADIHCHPSMKPYDSGLIPDVNKNLWKRFENKLELKLIGCLNDLLFHVPLYTQSNFESLVKGNVRICINSITPVEKGFCSPAVPGALDPIALILGSPNNKDLGYRTVSTISGIEKSKVAFISAELQDYYDELTREYKYILNSPMQDEGNPFSFKLVENYDEIQTILGDPAKSNCICLINSIEGAHSFGSGTAETENISDPELIRRLQNNIAEVKAWKYPPFFVTLNHHFHNQLGGHARSLMGLLYKLLDQKPGMNGGLTNVGSAVIDALLSDKNGKRILIDIKHMSATCRRDFYSMLETQYKDEQIPIICSHTGIIRGLDHLSGLMKQTDTDDFNKLHYLHDWTINLCKEDVQIIHRSCGLIGLQLDEKRLGGGIASEKISNARNRWKKYPSDANLRLYKNEYLKLVVANLIEAVRAIGDKTAWDILSIGSDNDGIINPLDFYSSADKFSELRSDLLAFFRDPVENPDVNLQKGFYKKYYYGLDPEEIVEKIMFGNVMKFLERNFR